MRFYEIETVADFERDLENDAELYLKMFGLKKQEAGYCVKKFYEFARDLRVALDENEQEEYLTDIREAKDYYATARANMLMMRSLALAEAEGKREKARAIINKGAGGWLVDACYDTDKLSEQSLYRVIAYLMMSDVLRAYE